MLKAVVELSVSDDRRDLAPIDNIVNTIVAKLDMYSLVVVATTEAKTVMNDEISEIILQNIPMHALNFAKRPTAYITKILRHYT
jgi:hypothetical protein